MDSKENKADTSAHTRAEQQRQIADSTQQQPYLYFWRTHSTGTAQPPAPSFLCSALCVFLCVGLFALRPSTQVVLPAVQIQQGISSAEESRQSAIQCEKQKPARRALAIMQ